MKKQAAVLQYSASTNRREIKMEALKVSSRSVPKSVAGAFAAVIREGNPAEVQAVGAGAVNQAVKAIAIAHLYFTEDERELVCVPSFSELEVNGEEKTGMSFRVELR